MHNISTAHVVNCPLFLELAIPAIIKEWAPFLTVVMAASQCIVHICAVMVTTSMDCRCWLLYGTASYVACL